MVKKMIKRIFAITACVLMSAVVFVGAALVYGEYFHAAEVDARTSPDGRYTLVFHQIGSPGWPFGPVTAQVSLKDGRRTIEKHRIEVYNDGAGLYASGWEVEWRGDRVVVKVDLGEVGGQETLEFFLK